MLSAQSIEDVSMSLIHPSAGQTLRPGETVEIQWAVSVPKELDCTWCEQEMYLSLDGGQTVSSRISRELGPDANRFTWIVPGTPSDNAVIVMHFGMESTQSFDIVRPQSASTFRILPPDAGYESIQLKPFSKDSAKAGKKIKIKWKSTVQSVASYEAYASFDWGANFQSVGTATRDSLKWTIPADFHGSIVFRIDARRTDGSTVSSVVNARPDIYVR
jgi:hypothetical protein